MTNVSFCKARLLARARWGVWLSLVASLGSAQEMGKPDRGQPGDEMIQAYLAAESRKLDAGFGDDLPAAGKWKARVDEYRRQYLYMLGLSPLPERTPLQVKITGNYVGAGFIVDNLHYQSRPGLYVTANLYRPTNVKQGERLPAVYFACGHSGRGPFGNKTAFQSHGIWLARHGYLCLMVDSLQLGEIASFHHGTYNLGRWNWQSRGYTPAGVECWNGIRGIDYLVSRPDVDPARIAVTGISGGGAGTFWLAAADPRVAVAIPVSGMADLESYVASRVINGHCDCMFLVNAFRWPWTRIAGLVAPRPMLFVNSDKDPIFPMDANERISNRLERLYSAFGASDQVDTVVSIGGHAYRSDIRQATFGFLNRYLKNDARPVLDSEVDLSDEGDRASPTPIPPEKLRVFSSTQAFPKDERNTTIDTTFVALADATVPKVGQWVDWKKERLAELRRVTFGALPEVVPAARKIRGENGIEWLATEPGIEVRMRREPPPTNGARTLLALAADGLEKAAGIALSGRRPTDAVVFLEPRGVGATRWTQKNPANYVERSLALLGRTADTGRVWDIMAAAAMLKEQSPARPVVVVGSGPSAVLGVYAALLSESITGVIVVSPSETHTSNAGPHFLNVLRVVDVPQAMAMLAPKSLEIESAGSRLFDSVKRYPGQAGVTLRPLAPASAEPKGR